jgi:serine/threonine-protein kinase
MGARQRYKIAEKIDAGGMAEIFRGHSYSLDGIQKAVAIKRVRPHLATNARFIKMFIDEARLCMRLNHANITQVFDVGRAQGTYFLVMELVDGINLRRMMQTASEKGMKIPIEIAVHLVIEVCKALSHAHEAKDEDGVALNIVHRDVSPPNVLISKQGEVKITDFGLAKAVTHLEATDPGVVKGKFSYLSPEAADGKKVDSRADIFSAGIVLHELLTARRLFMGKTDMETVELVRKCDLAPPSLINTEVDKDLDEAVMKALARDRKRRYQSAQEFGDALARYLFSHNRKVTTYDLAQLVRVMTGEQTAEAAPARIADMVREEVVNLSSLGGVGAGLAVADGAQPLDAAAFQTRKTPFEDIWQEFDSAAAGPPGAGREPGKTGTTGAPTGAMAKGAAPSGKKGGALKWVLLAGGLGLALAAALGYLVLFGDLLP